MKNQIFKKLLALTLLSGILITIPAGCIAVRDVSAETKNETLGQELIDLKEARDLDAISETEYQEQKAKLLSDEEM